MTTPEERAARNDAVLPTTRLLSAVIVPFLLAAFVVLYGFPTRTDRLFAWTIKPQMTPMMLGAVYLGGAYFFVRAFRASEWHTLKAGFVAVGTFATLMGIATIIHWDKFNHHHLAFWLWAGLYFTTPLLVAGTWLANRRTEARTVPGDLLLAPFARRALGAGGALAVAFGVFLFLAPAQAIAMWPWALTPLTSRVMGSIFMLGLAGIVVVADARWSTARLMLEVQSFMMALILVAAARARDELDASRPLTWMLLGGFAGALLGAVWLLATMRGRVRPGSVPSG